MVKRMLMALGGAVVAVAGLTPVASAQVAAAPDCQHGNTYGIKVAEKDLGVGVVQLCRDSSYYYWGFVILHRSPTASQYAEAAIVRYDRVAFVGDADCDSPGGNKKIVSGQTRCWTPKFDGRAGHWSFAATGYLVSSHTGDPVAGDTTVITR